MTRPSCLPLNAEHARLIARANGAPRGQRQARGRELVDFMRRQIEADIAAQADRQPEQRELFQ